MLKNIEGNNIPDITFHTIHENKWKDIKSSDFFKNKKVVVFSLPGAFTPTCSSSHVPRYNELFNEFKKNGVDAIVCISVNDTFVMNAWKEDQKAENITFLPDGNGEFTDAMGLLVDKSAIGFGKRSWRYSMLVENNKIIKMFIEPEKDGDPFEVSDADTMLNYIAPNNKKDPEVVIFTKKNCQHCINAKEVLNKNYDKYDEIILGKDVSLRSFRAITGQTTFPQVYIDGNHIGGHSELVKFVK